MPQLDILHFPDPRLRKVAKPVNGVTNTVRQLIDDMFETMYEAPGIGLAATQVGVAQRVVVIDVSDEHNEPLAFINPEIVLEEGETEHEEGCLSVPGAYELVDRAEKVTVKALNRDGEAFEMQADGLLAICIQHEIDHLDGKLFVDYISDLKRQRIRKRLEKEARDAEKAAAKARRKA